MGNLLRTGFFGPPIYLYFSVASIGENYNESTALVITFVVNNNVDEAQNEKAKAWEKEFLSFMQNFSDPDMIIAYSAEVRRVIPSGSLQMTVKQRRVTLGCHVTGSRLDNNELSR